MYLANRLLTIYTEESLHVGTGRGFGAMDLPIQRERVTHYPMIQATGIKGKLRAECDPITYPAREHQLDPQVFRSIFGDAGHEFAGALSVCDAAVLLFPVRSLNGIFAWVTCPDVLNRFARALERLDWKPGAFQPVHPLLQNLGEDEALVDPSSNNLIDRPGTLKDQVVLEEYSFTAKTDAKVGIFAGWLKQFFPLGDSAAYWRDQLPKKLCILPDNAFRDFVLYATEVQTHVNLDRDTKTVAEGPWTTESIPPDCLMYAPLLGTPPRQALENEEFRKAQGLMDEFERYFHLYLDRIQLGGDETTGQGFVALRLLKSEVK